ncbi:hypothetical protein ACHAWF_000463, partial [Thalassiosira exigua]
MQLLQARFGSLTFTEQKNGVRGEVIGLECSGDPYLCPVKALVRRVFYLRSENTVCNLETDLGLLPSYVLARCLRVAGATALLIGKVDLDVIRLVGCWHSDEMLRYLHVQAAPLMSDYARRMLHAGDYSLI